MTARRSSPQPAIARAAGVLLLFAGGLSLLRTAVEAEDDQILVSVLIAVTAAAGVLGLVVLLIPAQVPSWGVQVVPWLVTSLLCAPSYLLGSAGDSVPPLLVGAALLGGFVLPRALALLNVVVAVVVYAPAAVVVDSTLGLDRVVYLTAGCLVALLVVVPLRATVSGLLADAVGRERSDELTGLLNPRGFAQLLSHELAVCQRSGRSVAVLSVDLDGFSGINDAGGVATGDRVLRNTAQVLRTQMRDSDVLARTGGDEFGILLPACGRDDGLRRAEHIRSLLERTAATWPTPFTISVGLAAAPDHGATAEELTGAAAAALAVAKTAGGNRVEIAEPVLGSNPEPGQAESGGPPPGDSGISP